MSENGMSRDVQLFSSSFCNYFVRSKRLANSTRNLVIKAVVSMYGSVNEVLMMQFDLLILHSKSYITIYCYAS